jgi:hypothetical protein
VSWGDEFRKPSNIIALGTAIVGIVAGLLIGLYFYYKGERFGQISMGVDQVQVFDKTRMGHIPLKILDAAGRIITENVFVANVVIWNSGNDEITSSSIREPFHIGLENNTTPLDLSLVSSSSPYQGFQITPDGKIYWKHFDANQGFRLRIVYVTAEMQKIILHGTASGVGEIDFQEVVARNASRRYRLSVIIASLTVVGVIMALVSQPMKLTRLRYIGRIFCDHRNNRSICTKCSDCGEFEPASPTVMMAPPDHRGAPRQVSSLVRPDHRLRQRAVRDFGDGADPFAHTQRARNPELAAGPEAAGSIFAA